MVNVQKNNLAFIGRKIYYQSEFQVYLVMLADVGIPMMFIQWPLMICALIPVIIIEALLVRRWVKLSCRDAFIGVTKANLLSTLVGLPLAFVVIFVIQMVVLIAVAGAAQQRHWNLDSLQDSPFVRILEFTLGFAGQPDSAAYWQIPLAAALLLIPSFYVSVWVERFVCRWAWPNSDAAAVRCGVFRANLASYFVLFILACGWAGVEYYIHRT